MADKNPRGSHESARLDDQGLSEAATQELSQVVDDLLGQLSTKFSTISSELLTRMDDMSRRLDNLEARIQGGGDRTSGDQGK